MLSSVFVSGRLGPAPKEGERVRFVEVDRLVPEENSKFKVDRIPVKSQGRCGQFFSAKEGSFIIVKGRIEMDEKYGLVIVDELSEILQAKK